MQESRGTDYEYTACISQEFRNREAEQQQGDYMNEEQQTIDWKKFCTRGKW